MRCKFTSAVFLTPRLYPSDKSYLPGNHGVGWPIEPPENLPGEVEVVPEAGSDGRRQDLNPAFSEFLAF